MERHELHDERLVYEAWVPAQQPAPAAGASSRRGATGVPASAPATART